MNKQPLWLGVDPSANVANLDEGSAEFFNGQELGSRYITNIRLSSLQECY
jgi:hypothetical protein